MMKFQIDKGFTQYFYTSLLVIAIYLLTTSLPSFGLVDQMDFTGVLRYVGIPFIVVLLYADGFRLSKHRPIDLLLCLPLLLVCLGNLLSFAIASKTPLVVEESIWTRNLVYTLGTALAEEIVFRFGLYEALKKTSIKKFALPVSAVIFGLCHLGALLGGSAILPTLAQAGYTAALGLVWGAAYEIGGLLPAVICHFFFNFLQSDLYVALGAGNWDWTFMFLNIGLYVVSLGYGLLILFLRHKKNLAVVKN